MAGNNIYVQGSYIDIHDNEEVNLSVDKGEVHVGDSQLSPEERVIPEVLAKFCYYEMFKGCASLKDAYVKAAFDNTNDECTNMFTGCSAAGAKLHTTSANKASWTGKVPGTMEVEDDWTD